MRSHLLRLFFGIFAAGLIAPGLHAQENQQKWQSLYQVYGGYSLLSNSPNGVKGARQPLNGFDAELGMLRWHGLRFKVATADYRGTNLNANEDLLFITGGGEYDHRLGREVGFLEGLMGNVAINKNWMQNGEAGQTASFLGILGGGLDTPIGHNLAIRVKADFTYMNLHAAIVPEVQPFPIYDTTVHGLPNIYVRGGAGLVWYF